MLAVIIAGGKGTRLLSLTKNKIPKPMICIAGKPLLEIEIEHLRKQGIDDLVILTQHKASAIKRHFGDGLDFGVRIFYSKEPYPLGTAGAVKYAQDIIDDKNEPFFIIYGDKFWNMDLNKVMEFHERHGGIATVVVHPTDHPQDSDLVELNGDKVTGFNVRPHDPNKYYSNIANASIYVVEPKIFQHISTSEPSDFARDIFPTLCQIENIYAYNTTEYIKDVGTPQRFGEITEDFKNGRTKKKTKAIFLDRDGTVTHKKGEVLNSDDLKLLVGVAESIRQINKSEYLAVLVTNQPEIAKGMCSEESVKESLKKLETELGMRGAYLDRIYYCPHHPEKGFKGEVKKYKIVCPCRKPNTGMLMWAQTEMGINLNESIIIGDTTLDFQCGKNAKLKAVYGVKTGYGGEDKTFPAKPDKMFADLPDAIKFILGEGNV